MDEFARFMASRDPLVVSREWTTARFGDVLREGRAESPEEERARVDRLLAESKAFDMGGVCRNGHQIEGSDLYVVHPRVGGVRFECKQCASERAKASRVAKIRAAREAARKEAA